MYGVIGENTDIGAGTVCGTLRFDDNKTQHNINGKKQTHEANSNAIFLGDYTRTGAYSLVGPGVVLSKDLPSKNQYL